MGGRGYNYYMDSYLLNNELDGQDILINSKKSGLIKIRKIDNSSEVVLDVDDNFGEVGNNYCDAVKLLSYFLNTPINIKRRLTYSGNYIPL